MGDLQVFDIKRQMYDYDSIQKQMKRLERMYETQVNTLDSILDPDDIKQRFRFYPYQILELCDLLDPYLMHPTKRNNSLSMLTQVCTALFYYGYGKSFKISFQNLFDCCASRHP